jgi:hypothetical protein
MILASFKIKIGQNGECDMPPEFAEFCKSLQAGSYFIQLRDDAPESRWTRLMQNSIHGDMEVLSAATDHNVSAHEWKVTCKMMRPDLFVYKSSIRNPITNAMPDILRSLSDPELSRRDVLDWMETYRRNMEQVWYNGNRNVNPPVKPLKEVYSHCPVLYWFTQNDQMMREIAQKEKREKS